MDSDHHEHDPSAKPKNGCSNNMIVKANLEVKDIQEVKEKPKRKARKGFLKASAKPKNGCSNNMIIKANLEVKDIQEVKEKPKRKARKGFLKAAARNLCRLKAFTPISPVKVLCRCRDLYVQALLSCNCGQADTTAFISPESGGRIRQAPPPADSSSTSSNSSRRREEENLRRLMKVTESKTQSDKHQEFVDDHDEELMAMSAKAISTSLGLAFGIPRSNSVNNNNHSSFSWTSIAPIDEESPCYFPGSFKKKWATSLPRSASTTTTSTTI